MCITFFKIFSNRKIAFLFDGYDVEKQTKNFFKVARNLASLRCNLSTKGENDSQPVGNSDKYNLSAKEEATMQKSLKHLPYTGFT